MKRICQAGYSRNVDMNNISVVVGASRGIGLAMVRDLLRRTKGKVIGGCRSPDRAEELQRLRVEHGDRLIVGPPIDMVRPDSIEHFGNEIETMTNGRVDVLINTVGILHSKSSAPQAPERSLRHLTPEWFEESLRTNTVGPLLLLRRFASMMRTKGSERPTSVAATLSARVGSISDNGLGGWYSYRISKAALNMGLRTASLELRRQGTRILALHPGTVETDLSEPFVGNVTKKKLLTPDQSARALLDVVDRMGGMPEESPSDYHEFYDFNGIRVEW